MRSILYVITKSDHGGAQYYVALQIEAMRTEGFLCTLVTSSSGWLTEKVRLYCDVVIVPELAGGPSIGIRLYRLLKRMRDIFRSGNFSVIHLNSSFTLALGAVAQWCSRSNIVFTYHGLSVAHPLLKKNIFFGYAYRIFFPSSVFILIMRFFYLKAIASSQKCIIYVMHGLKQSFKMDCRN